MYMLHVRRTNERTQARAGVSGPAGPVLAGPIFCRKRGRVHVVSTRGLASRERLINIFMSAFVYYTKDQLQVKELSFDIL